MYDFKKNHSSVKNEPSKLSKYPNIFSKSRKRIETQCAHLNYQFRIKNKLCKTMLGFEYKNMKEKVVFFVLQLNNSHTMASS